MAIQVTSSDFQFLVAVEGLKALDGLEKIPADIERAAFQAINKALDRTRAAAAREMTSQVAFPRGYLSGQNGRLEVSKAQGGKLEGKISGRFRPTSLARFLVGKPKPSKPGVTVKVSPGKSIRLNRTFAIRLRSGRELTETNYNLGLAIRLKPGETITNKKIVLQSMGKSGLYLLYGPSVDQVFTQVSEDVAPFGADVMEDEFLRLLDLNKR